MVQDSKTGPVKPKNKTHATGTHELSSDPRKHVFVWDLDETLIVFHSLCTRLYCRANPNLKYDDEVVQQLGVKWSDLILFFCDEFLHFAQVEHLDPVHITETAGTLAPNTGADGRPAEGSESSEHDVAALYTQAGHVFSHSTVSSLLTPDQAAAHNALYEETDRITGGWLQASHDLLLALQNAKPGKVEHIVVSSGQLVATLAKLMLFKLDKFFPLSHIYSSSKASKLSCFLRIVDRFGPNCRYCVIGDGSEEAAAAAEMSWPYVKIVLNEYAPHVHTSFLENHGRHWRCTIKELTAPTLIQYMCHGR